jgi:hypothetical protein
VVIGRSQFIDGRLGFERRIFNTLTGQETNDYFATDENSIYTFLSFQLGDFGLGNIAGLIEEFLPQEQWIKIADFERSEWDVLDEELASIPVPSELIGLLNLPPIIPTDSITIGGSIKATAREKDSETVRVSLREVDVRTFVIEQEIILEARFPPILFLSEIGLISIKTSTEYSFSIDIGLVRTRQSSGEIGEGLLTSFINIDQLPNIQTEEVLLRYSVK